MYTYVVHTRQKPHQKTKNEEYYKCINELRYLLIQVMASQLLFISQLPTMQDDTRL